MSQLNCLCERVNYAPSALENVRCLAKLLLCIRLWTCKRYFVCPYVICVFDYNHNGHYIRHGSSKKLIRGDFLVSWAVAVAFTQIQSNYQVQMSTTSNNNVKNITIIHKTSFSILNFLHFGFCFYCESLWCSELLQRMASQVLNLPLNVNLMRFIPNTHTHTHSLWTWIDNLAVMSIHFEVSRHFHMNVSSFATKFNLISFLLFFFFFYLFCAS